MVLYTDFVTVEIKLLGEVLKIQCCDQTTGIDIRVKGYSPLEQLIRELKACLNRDENMIKHNLSEIGFYITEYSPKIFFTNGDGIIGIPLTLILETENALFKLKRVGDNLNICCFERPMFNLIIDCSSPLRYLVKQLSACRLGFEQIFPENVRFYIGDTPTDRFFNIFFTNGFNTVELSYLDAGNLYTVMQGYKLPAGSLLSVLNGDHFPLVQSGLSEMLSEMASLMYQQPISFI